MLKATLMTISDDYFFIFLSILFSSDIFSWPSFPHLWLLLNCSSNNQWNSWRTSLLTLIQHTEGPAGWSQWLHVVYHVHLQMARLGCIFILQSSLDMYMHYIVSGSIFYPTIPIPHLVEASIEPRSSSSASDCFNYYAIAWTKKCSSYNCQSE